jgi:pentatricopeptide repeat protein
MYVTFQALEEARRVFHTIPHPDSVSWTSLISGYSKWGLIDEAFTIFQLMPQKNSASWNAMMAAYVQTNRFHEAFALFDRMKAENNNVLDKFVATTMLSACTGLGALDQGKWIHEYIKRNGIELDSKLTTAIVDMYCKCGCLEKALQVFHSLPLPCRWISSWNCMIGGLAMHGNGEAAIQLFKEMERQRVAPDDITFLNLLTACAHSGLVEEGRNYFSYMIRVYGIEPRMEHFGCMVDLLGRAGMVPEARKLIDEMPVSPDVTVLGTLLGACKKHRNIELGEEIGRRVIELEPNNSGRYVLLANLYANAGKWEDVAKVRKLMDDRGVKKAPGFSMIELQGTVHEFIAGERNHPQAKELHAKVYEMLEHLKSVGYVADTNGVLHGHDFDEEEDGENPLYYHSEKLAIAFGLSRTKPGETLRILKNLRICEDCHHACKLISTVFDREIIVRDRTRFHRFKMGQCSCQDYW